jgi:hypothetical protein
MVKNSWYSHITELGIVELTYLLLPLGLRMLDFPLKFLSQLEQVLDSLPKGPCLLFLLLLNYSDFLFQILIFTFQDFVFGLQIYLSLHKATSLVVDPGWTDWTDRTLLLYPGYPWFFYQSETIGPDDFTGTLAVGVGALPAPGGVSR